MRRLPAVLSALVLGFSLLLPGYELAIADVLQATIPENLHASRAARLRTAQDGLPGNDPDTVWIGHIYDATYTAGGKMQAGGYGPYHVGRGPNRPTRLGGTIGDNATWDFDRFQAGEADSLRRAGGRSHGRSSLARPHKRTIATPSEVSTTATQ